MIDFIFSLSFLTIFPGLKFEKKESYSAVYFPIVGFLIGLLLSSSFFVLNKLFSPLISSILVVLFETVLSRSFHLDGFSDFFDGMFGGQTKEDKLRIMKDPHIGVFGTVSLIFLILLKVSVLSSFGNTFVYLILLIMPMVSRWLILYPILKIPYAKESGLGKILNLTVGKFVSISLVVFIITFIFLSFKGLVSIAVLVIFLMWIIRVVNKRIGGMTGDVYGFIVEAGEVLFLIVFLLLIKI